MIRFIAALDSKRGIANEQGIPWQGKLPTDVAYFRSKTIHGAVMMGYGWYVEQKLPLPERRNLVATSKPEQLREGFEKVSDAREFLEHTTDDIWVGGGAALFDSTLDLADELYLTRIDHDFNCTKFFPEFEKDFVLATSTKPQTENGLTFHFEVWHKKKPRSSLAPLFAPHLLYLAKMSDVKNPLLSVVVPVYNEANGLEAFHETLTKAVEALCGSSYEILYCDDGSSDRTPELVRQWHHANPRVMLIRFSRNFGKESALSAGIIHAHGQAIMMLDGDGQHPIELLPEFLAAWKDGARVIVGVRKVSKSDGWFKRLGSRLFYYSFNKVTTQKLMAGATDFRLIDKSVQQAFMSLPETDRITRGLIDWLGFKRQLIYFEANERQAGAAGYGKKKLIKLATTSFVSLSPTPLYMFGYLGILITIGSFCLGLAVLIEQIILNDPWHWKFTGTAMLGILILFLVGIVLMSQGILSLYISHMQEQSRRRPLYVIDQEASVGIKET